MSSDFSVVTRYLFNGILDARSDTQYQHCPVRFCSDRCKQPPIVRATHLQGGCAHFSVVSVVFMTFFFSSGATPLKAITAAQPGLAQPPETYHHS
jgi:hypothetical protein